MNCIVTGAQPVFHEI